MKSILQRTYLRDSISYGECLFHGSRKTKELPTYRSLKANQQQKKKKI